MQQSIGCHLARDTTSQQLRCGGKLQALALWYSVNAQLYAKKGIINIAWLLRRLPLRSVAILAKVAMTVVAPVIPVPRSISISPIAMSSVVLGVVVPIAAPVSSTGAAATALVPPSAILISVSRRRRRVLSTLTTCALVPAPHLFVAVNQAIVLA